MVHPQNVNLQNARFQNVRLQKVCLEHTVLREEFLVVDKNDQANHIRTLEKSYQRQDTQSSVNGFVKLEPKSFMERL